MPDSVARVKHVFASPINDQTDGSGINKAGDTFDLPNSWIICVSKSRGKFVMVDVPKYSQTVMKQIIKFCNGVQPIAIVITNQNSVYYDDANGSMVIRRSDAIKWAEAFPGIEIVMHRHDIYRDLQKVVTQRLDGYGPWGLNLDTTQFVDLRNPLQEIDGLDGFEMTFDVENYSTPDFEEVNIRENDCSKYFMAVYSPGHSYGSLSLIAPELGGICSGNTFPPISLLDGTNLRMDSQGIVTTNRAGITKQVESAKNIISEYVDLFQFMLPARGPLQRFPVDLEQRKHMLNDLINRFEEYKIYEEKT